MYGNWKVLCGLLRICLPYADMHVCACYFYHTSAISSHLLMEWKTKLVYYSIGTI